MSDKFKEPTEPIIRLTADELNSSHVDDLLQRQASIRGEQGITANRKRPWYYRNWLVFMLAGSLGAVIAWAIVEPGFQDLLYYQSSITAVDMSPPQQFRDLMFEVEIVAVVELDNESILLFKETKEFSEDSARPLDLSQLQVGNDAGFYVEVLEPPGERAFAIASFVDLAPPADSPNSDKSLSRMAVTQTAIGMLLFPCVGGLVGLLIGSADGLVCRLLRRSIVAGLVGLLVGFVGAFISQFIAGLVYVPLNTLAMSQTGDSTAGMTTLGFVTQMTGRSLAWCLAGMTMGIGQGIALRSRRLVLYGFLGGAVGGLLGGLLFDPLDLLILGIDKPSAHVSRLFGLAVIGACVGAMIGIVELLARDAWLHMVEGPLAGKEFLLFKDRLSLGASPRSDIYLFNDDQVAQHHATIRTVGNNYEIDTVDGQWPLLVNGRPVDRTRLRHGDNIVAGKTVFVFNQKKTG